MLTVLAGLCESNVRLNADGLQARSFRAGDSRWALLCRYPSTPRPAWRRGCESRQGRSAQEERGVSVGELPYLFEASQGGGGLLW